MTRRMKKDGHTYRAFVRMFRTVGDNVVFEDEFFEGPYATASAARARVTFHRNDAARWNEGWDDRHFAVTGHVEKSTTTWERV